MAQTTAIVPIDFRISRRLSGASAAVIVDGDAASRLSAEGMGAETAAGFANAFLEDTLAAVEQAIVAAKRLSKEIVSARPSLRASTVFLPQGERSSASWLTHLASGAQSHFSASSICILGNSTPHLPPAFILEAFGKLAHSDTDVVFGSSEDGSLYLIGLRPELAGRFDGVIPGAPDAFAAARDRAHRGGLRSSVLPRWYGVDTIDGLDRLRVDLARGIVAAPGTASLLALYDPYKAVAEGNASTSSMR